MHIQYNTSVAGCWTKTAEREASGFKFSEAIVNGVRVVVASDKPNRNLWAEAVNFMHVYEPIIWLAVFMCLLTLRTYVHLIKRLHTPMYYYYILIL